MKFRYLGMPSLKAKCYSYVRWSSGKQAKGSSSSRQEDLIEQIAREHDLEVAKDSFRDEGVSAFKGANKNKGALGVFIEAVRENHIHPDSWLIVENLDRISRQKTIRSLSTFIEILELGITIVTGMDRKVYSQESIGKNDMELMYSLMLFARAHEESQTKSKRTSASALKVIADNKTLEADGNTLRKAIESVGSNVFWVDTTDGYIRKHETYYPAAVDIINLVLSGWGNYRIAGYLNENYPPLPPRKPYLSPQGTPPEARPWKASLISKFCKQRALMGEKNVTIEGTIHTIQNYYPKLLTEDDFYKIQKIRESKISKSTSKTSVTLLSGIGVLRCGHCGGSMYAFRHKGKTLRYICGNGQQNKCCRAWSFNASWAEDTLLRLAANKVFRPNVDMTASNLDQHARIERLRDRESRLDNMVKFVQQGNLSNTIAESIQTLEIEIENIKLEIEQQKAMEQVLKLETVEWEAVDEKALDETEDEIRLETRHKISNSVRTVSCVQVKQRCVQILITFSDGSSIIAYRTPSTLVFDGCAWMKLGDHYGKKVKVPQNYYAKNFPEDPPDYRDKFLQETEKKLRETGTSEEDIKLILELQRKADQQYEEEVDPNEELGYMFKGIHNLSNEMSLAHNNGDTHKYLEHDINRLEVMTTWGKNHPGAPSIIEDQYKVYRHKVKKRMIKKATPEIYYINNVVFYTDRYPAWQQRPLGRL